MSGGPLSWIPCKHSPPWLSPQSSGAPRISPRPRQHGCTAFKVAGQAAEGAPSAFPVSGEAYPESDEVNCLQLSPPSEFSHTNQDGGGVFRRTSVTVICRLLQSEVCLQPAVTCNRFRFQQLGRPPFALLRDARISAQSCDTVPQGLPRPPGRLTPGLPRHPSSPGRLSQHANHLLQRSCEEHLSNRRRGARPGPRCGGQVAAEGPRGPPGQRQEHEP